MKKIFTRLGLILGVVTMGASCTTAYDSSGRPHKVVTPEGALIGVAAAGVLAYSLGKSNKRKHRHYSNYGYGHHRGHSYNHGYRNYGYRGGYGGGYGGYSCR